MTTVGFLYPGHSAEDDYPLLENLLGAGVRLPVAHTDMGEDAHRVDALLEMGAIHRLTRGLAELEQHDVDAVMWACTSASFVYGLRGAGQQAAELAQAAGVPASSTSFAFVHALRSLGLSSVSVAATYPEDVAGYFVRFLQESGVAVARVSGRGIVTAAEVGTLSREQVVDLVKAEDHPDAEAVLLPDTALHTAAWLDELEVAVGKPVLTANQVTVWEGLRLAGDTAPRTGLGRLFRQGTTPPTPSAAG
ncbi:maleate cis-trans isomerase family protein [Streptomyces sp. NPDC003393]